MPLPVKIHKSNQSSSITDGVIVWAKGLQTIALNPDMRSQNEGCDDPLLLQIIDLPRLSLSRAEPTLSDWTNDIDSWRNVLAWDDGSIMM